MLSSLLGRRNFWFTTRDTWVLIWDVWELRKCTPLLTSMGTVVVLIYCSLNPEIYALSGRVWETVEELTTYPVTSHKAQSVLIHMVTWVVFKRPFREHLSAASCNSLACCCSRGNQTGSPHNKVRTLGIKLNMFYSLLLPLCFFSFPKHHHFKC